MINVKIYIINKKIAEKLLLNNINVTYRGIKSLRTFSGEIYLNCAVAPIKVKKLKSLLLLLIKSLP